MRLSDPVCSSACSCYLSSILYTTVRSSLLFSGNQAHVRSNFLDEQLKQVVDEIGINRAEIQPFSRCIQCNLIIVEISKDNAYGRVPDYIWETQEAFNQCRQCERIYWPGSHAERSMERIEQLFK